MSAGRRPVFLLALASLACALGDAIVLHGSALAALAPFFVLLAPLLSGRYVAERRLAALAAPRRRLLRPARSSPLRVADALVAPAALRLGRSFAVRPPPA